MSDPARTPAALPATIEPLRVAVRRMRWFKAALRRHLDTLGTEIGCDFAVDEARLAGIFVRWLRTVEAQKPAGREARRAYFEFSAGLMLRELIADMPIAARAAPTRAAPDSAAAFWPEGYACTMFCLSVNAAAMAQEFDAETSIAPQINDLRQWWSFRENAARDPAFSIAFLDMLMGHQPDWMMPDVFSRRLQRELAGGVAARALG